MKPMAANRLKKRASVNVDEAITALNDALLRIEKSQDPCVCLAKGRIRSATETLVLAEDLLDGIGA